MKRKSYIPMPGDDHRRAWVAIGDPDTRRHMREALSRAGYRADVYGDSRMVLEDHATSGHSFLILQGDEAGTDAVRLIRRRIGEIPVILLTGAPSKADLAAGSVGHLSTPFTLRTLQAAIARAVD